jgi:hypothetical protein
MGFIKHQLCSTVAQSVMYIYLSLPTLVIIITIIIKTKHSYSQFSFILVSGYKRDQDVSNFEGLESLKISHHIYCFPQGQDRLNLL